MYYLFSQFGIPNEALKTDSQAIYWIAVTVFSVAIGVNAFMVRKAINNYVKATRQDNNETESKDGVIMFDPKQGGDKVYLGTVGKGKKPFSEATQRLCDLSGSTENKLLTLAKLEREYHDLEAHRLADLGATLQSQKHFAKRDEWNSIAFMLERGRIDEEIEAMENWIKQSKAESGLQ